MTHKHGTTEGRDDLCVAAKQCIISSGDFPLGLPPVRKLEKTP